jgi:hypothetical protein
MDTRTPRQLLRHPCHQLFAAWRGVPLVDSHASLVQDSLPMHLSLGHFVIGHTPLVNQLGIGTLERTVHKDMRRYV